MSAKADTLVTAAVDGAMYTWHLQRGTLARRVASAHLGNTINSLQLCDIGVDAEKLVVMTTAGK
jgi:hypothetical protein